MRIIAGKYKGLLIKAPADIRPTLELIRKALFSILGDVIIDARFLELFCGSGIVGIEALSLGAKEVICVDSSFKSILATKTNLFNVTKSRDHQVYQADAIKTIELLAKKKDKFDIIFLDPPYYKELSKKTLITLGDYDILAPNGVIICQHYKKDVLPQAYGVLAQFKQKNYGDTSLTFYEHSKESTLSGNI